MALYAKPVTPVASGQRHVIGIGYGRDAWESGYPFTQMIQKPRGALRGVNF
jgi:hypothetical protein